ncbi:hypothetical protein Pth03_76210 [Planotetraspora thailandica]|uniref:Uncharacterized protein n=1 Tax=Planotetraspora thailandica TaxID=487172 RepID=A0A8J3Y1X1_9ACTN|nr:hypothetical protein [Planotetraspora thailandica]GII59232.1 hypothetical protein Pth03_76210 [Planotetraspora thailandica]
MYCSPRAGSSLSTSESPVLAAAQPGQSLDHADLYAVVWAVNHVHVLTPLALQIADSGAPWTAERWQQLRAAVVTAVGRIVQDSAGS